MALEALDEERLFFGWPPWMAGLSIVDVKAEGGAVVVIERAQSELLGRPL
jgi:hypothetical protein